MAEPLSLKQAFSQPAALIMFVFGFASGLPFLLVGGTLAVWLTESKIRIEDIGLMSLVGLTYSLKFLWSPLTDQVQIPLLGRLGKRRSWLILSQLVLAASFAGMALLTPQPGTLAVFVAVALLAAFAGATQDIVVDAYRIEIAPQEAQGALAATYSLGYRIALLVSGALALLLADILPWSVVYATMAALMIGLAVATFFSPEPQHLPQTPRSFSAHLREGVVAPFQDFFQRFAAPLGIVMLCFIGLIKLSDQMLGVMALPFYLSCGFTKPEVAAVSKMFGVWVGIAGAFIGGVSVLRLGLQRTLLIGIVIGAVSNLLYVLLAWFPRDIALFTLVIGGENLAGGFLGSATVAYLSALVNQRYTATQYALFSSLVSLPGKLVGGFSGFVVAKIGYAPFFVLTTLAVIPATLLYFWLRDRVPLETAPASSSESAGQGSQ